MPFAKDSRAEAFELRFTDGRLGHATLGLSRQEVDAVGASDPDLIHAVRAWLCARGKRTLDLHVREGHREHLLAEGSFEARSLGTHHAGERAKRVITLCPSNAEMVHALGCFERVIACEDSSDYPAEVTERE